MSAVFSQQAELEAVGPHFDTEKMMFVRALTREAIQQIAAAVRPGMVEEDAVDMAKDLLADKGMLRGWHDVYVRFGRNTTKTFGAPSEPGVVLGDDDIFLIDIGPTWQQWEGDGGDTFTTGSNAELARCARDARDIFHETRRHWLATQASGRALYAFAVAAAEQRGWTLNLDLSGHRIADFPHAAIHQGPLAEVEFTPARQLWVLEIHIRNAAGTFGAFYEDMLLEDAYFE